MRSRFSSRKKLQLMILSSFVIAVVLLIVNIFMLFKMGSLQNQIDDLKDTQLKKITELESANAAAKEKETNEKNKDDEGQSLEDVQTAEPTEAPKVDATLESGVNYVYLTFDDGPSKNTERILSVLDQYGIKATFFVNGREDAESIARYKRIAEAGHELAMHSYSHDYEDIYASTENFIMDLDRIQTLIESITGKKPMVYRFPGGSSNGLDVRQLPMKAFADVLAERGIVYFDWNVDSTDGAGAERPVETLIAQSQYGLGKHQQSVILLHDAPDHNTTVEALPSIIQACIDKGLKFDVLTENTPVVQHTLAN